MPILHDYDQFQGLHWETGSLRNYLDFMGGIAPHTNLPYSEAMLLGISGGIVMGYFTFEYEGTDPQVRILTRNTFDPLAIIYQRLGLQTRIHQTSSPEKGVQNLIAILESGSPAIVYADRFSLPYNALHGGEGMWAMLPILVYGYDQEADLVWVADRSRKSLTITTRELAVACGRTKANKYRLLVHSLPIPELLVGAVEAGLHDCVKLFTQPPPKGSKYNFGFLAYEKWTQQLINPNQRSSWEKKFPPGPRMFAVLTSAFEDISIYGKGGHADRELYASFLDEASNLLSMPGLTDIAEQFRISARVWEALANVLLPDRIPLLKETRELMLNKHTLFLNNGLSALDQMIEINKRLSTIYRIIPDEFSLTASQAAELHGEIADKVMQIHTIEFEAINNLQDLLQRRN